MLDQLTFSGRELLAFVILSAVFATVLYLLESLVFARRRKPAVSAAAEARIQALESELDVIRARLENLEAKPPMESSLDTQAVTYADAMRLAREGVTAAELAAQLGISRSEAELIIALRHSEA